MKTSPLTFVNDYLFTRKGSKAMKKTVNEYDFRDAFKAYGRQENFSHEGLGVLYEYLCDLEEDVGEEFELDVIALCCDYSEYSIEDAIEQYGDSVNFAPDPDLDDEDNTEAFIELLRYHTTVIRVNDDTIIIQEF